MDTRSQSDFVLNYDDIYKHITGKYAHLLEPTAMGAAYDKLRYKNTCYVLKGFLNAYTTLRSPKQASFFDVMQQVAQTIASYLLRYEPANLTIATINRDVLRAIKSVSTLSDMLGLLINLRKYAEIAQGKKLQSGVSVFFLTLHSMACHIITSYQKELEPITTALCLEHQAICAEKEKDHREKYGARAAELNAQDNLILCALALFNDFIGIDNAGRQGLLPHYEKPTASEKELCAQYEEKYKRDLKSWLPLALDVPIIYQTLCPRFVYEGWYHVQQGKSFDEFIAHAIATGKNDDEKEAKEKSGSLSFKSDFLIAPNAVLDVAQLPGQSPSAYVLTPEAMWYVDRASKQCERLDIPKEELNKYHAFVGELGLDKKMTAPVSIDDQTLVNIAYLEQQRQEQLKKALEAEGKQKQALLQGHTPLSSSRPSTPPVQQTGLFSSGKTGVASPAIVTTPSAQITTNANTLTTVLTEGAFDVNVESVVSLSPPSSPTH